MSDQRRRSGSALVSTVVALVVILGAGLAGASQSGLGEIVAQAQRVFSLPGGTHARVQASDRLPPGEEAGESPDVVQPFPGEDGDGLVGSRARDAADGEQTEGSNVGSSDDVGGIAGGDAGEESVAEAPNAGDDVGGGGNGGNGGSGGNGGKAGGGGSGGSGGNGGSGGSGAGGGGGSGGNGGSGGGTPGGGGHASGGSTGNSSGESSSGGAHGGAAGGTAGGGHNQP